MDSQALEDSLAALEGRVRALEQTVAVLQDIRAIEERVAERVTATVPKIPVAAVVEALSTQPLPPAVKDLVDAHVQPSTLAQVARSSWLAFDMVQEVIAVGRMLLDPRYHTAWLTRILVIAIVIGVFTSGLWVPLSSWAIIGPIVNKIADLILAGLLFVALFCETRRYKEWRSKGTRP
jgi:hypothetical protein